MTMSVCFCVVFLLSLYFDLNKADYSGNQLKTLEVTVLTTFLSCFEFINLLSHDRWMSLMKALKHIWCFKLPN